MIIMIIVVVVVVIILIDIQIMISGELSAQHCEGVWIAQHVGSRAHRRMRGAGSQADSVQVNVGRLGQSLISWAWIVPTSNATPQSETNNI